MKQNKLTLEFLEQRGYIPTCLVGAGNVIHNKWGFELNIHCNFVYCEARIGIGNKYETKNIHYENQLIDIEKQLNIDKTQNISKMSIDELKSLLPDNYTYTLNKRKRYKRSETNLSFSKAKGRYRITKGNELISEGYNDEEEDYFLIYSILFILKEENKLPKNPSLS